MSEHQHKYVEVETGAEGKVMRCDICGKPESEDERICRIVIETVLADFRANGPMRMALLGL